jgi:hypothetical protein
MALIYPWSPMGISLTPTFVHIVVFLTWMIDLLAFFVVIGHVVGYYRAYGIVPMPPWTKESRQVKIKTRLGELEYGRTFYFVVIPLLALVLFFTRLAQHFLPMMPPTLSRTIFGVAVMLVFALLLFNLKLEEPTIYGVLEGLFAIISCGCFLAQMKDDKLTETVAIGLMSSIYLMIRSFDNVKRGIDQARPEKEKQLLEQIKALSKKLRASGKIGGQKILFAAEVTFSGELFLVLEIYACVVGNKKEPRDPLALHCGFVYRGSNVSNLATPSITTLSIDIIC